MRTSRMLAFSAIAFLVASAAPAAAVSTSGFNGGYDAFFYETQFLWPGQTATWTTHVFPGRGTAGPDDGPFIAYLVEADRSFRTVPRVHDGVQIGAVEISSERDQVYFEATVSFNIPTSTPLGDYLVEVCDDPCTTRLEYLYPTPVKVVSSDLEARLTERISTLSGKLRGLRAGMDGQARRAKRGSSKLLRAQTTLEARLESEISGLASRVGELEERMDSQETTERADISQSALAGGVVVLVLGAWLLRERTRSRGSLQPDP